MSERIRVGLSLLDLWGKYGVKKIEFEIKSRNIRRLSSHNFKKIRQLGGSLWVGQVPLIDRNDAVARSLSQADFSSVQSMREFVEGFPDLYPPTNSLSVIQRREELSIERMTEAERLLDDYGKQILKTTREYLKSLL